MDDWGGRGISQNDIDIAAHLHPEIKEEYSFYTISSPLKFRRLNGSESFYIITC